MTLKQLQAQWRAHWKRMESVGNSEGGYYKAVADALTPFILQQERDRELIEDLLRAAEQDEALSMKIIEQARSRLKEMEE